MLEPTLMPSALLLCLLYPFHVLSVSTTRTHQLHLVPGPSHDTNTTRPKLHGRFLHITDLHFDYLYKPQTSPSRLTTCHRGTGSAGSFGSPRSDCDTPQTLVTATFDWLSHHLTDIDFVIWTGDSVRHDPDPSDRSRKDRRSRREIVAANRLVARKLRDVFPGIPVVPSIGNNDVLPHNTFGPAPNRWTRVYEDIWRDFIPADARKGFLDGGYLAVDVVPGLRVVSLNTLILFNKNRRSGGCETAEGKGQMRWLEAQLDRARWAGTKVLVEGHVPPGTAGRRYWTASCWTGYVDLMHSYRDVVVSSLFGHANVDHFLLLDVQDTDDVSPQHSHDSRKTEDDASGLEPGLRLRPPREARHYMSELRQTFAKLPKAPTCDFDRAGKRCLARWRKYYKAVGGEAGERFAISHVAPSIVPNYFPALRVYEYNMTGLDALRDKKLDEALMTYEESVGQGKNEELGHIEPGPAYKAQTLSLISYKQYFANLTQINNEYEQGSNDTFSFEELYDTKTDPAYRLPDLTVMSYLGLAERLAKGIRKHQGSNAVWTTFLRRAYVGAFEDTGA